MKAILKNAVFIGFTGTPLLKKDKRKAWKAQKANMESQVIALQEQIDKLRKKKRLYSWQQAEGIITDEELLSAQTSSSNRRKAC